MTRTKGAEMIAVWEQRGKNTVQRGWTCPHSCKLERVAGILCSPRRKRVKAMIWLTLQTRLKPINTNEMSWDYTLYWNAELALG